MENVKIAELIRKGETVLGMEFGSTRIKAVLIDTSGNPLASGSHGWENRLENQIWTYSLTDIKEGLQDCYAKLKQDVQEKYGETLKRVAAMGFSGMMHGYMAFDAQDQLLVPFRTWRNTMTEQAAKELSETFSFNIPAALECGTSVSGNFKWGVPCKPDQFCDYAGRLHSLAAYRRESGWCR